MSIPAIGIVNPDGSVTHIAPHPSQVTAQVATSHVTGQTSLKSVPHTVSLAGGTQIVTLSPGSAGSGGYSIIQPQQMQTISIDGQEAIYIPASSLSTGQQAIQIGNQIISPGNIVARGNASNASQNQQQQQQVIQGNVQFAQLGTGQTVAVRQAGGTNVLQNVIQMPMQQSIPIQIPISTANGQTVYQTIHLPLQTLQAISAGNVTAQVVPQMSQVQVAGHQLQVTQQSGATGATGTQIKQEPGLESSQSSTQTTTTTSNSNAGQTVVANVQLPNGQIGQIVQTMVQQPQQIAWSGNTINLGNLTGQ
jgi:transcription factor Sp